VTEKKMEKKSDSSSRDEWSLYTDPTLFQVRAIVQAEGWISLTLETNPENVQLIGRRASR